MTRINQYAGRLTRVSREFPLQHGTINNNAGILVCLDSDSAIAIKVIKVKPMIVRN